MTKEELKQLLLNGRRMLTIHSIDSIETMKSIIEILNIYKYLWSNGEKFTLESCHYDERKSMTYTLNQGNSRRYQITFSDNDYRLGDTISASRFVSLATDGLRNY